MNPFLTDAQLNAEISKCEFCEEKPCREACPADCSPADFIMAVRRGAKQDFRRSAGIILGSNPLGGICGAVCPDFHCMKACVHKNFNTPVEIPMVQATIIQKAKDLNSMPQFIVPEFNGMRIAIIGAGPAGIGAASVLIQKGYEVDILEKDEMPGGMCKLIPDERLDKEVLYTDIDFLTKLGRVNIYLGNDVPDLSSKEYDAVIVSTGLDEELSLGINGEKFADSWKNFLSVNFKKAKGKKVLVVGGGAVAVDCAVTAKNYGAKSVEMLCLETLAEMPLTSAEKKEIFENDIEVSGRAKVDSISAVNGKIKFVTTSKVILPQGKKFHPRNIISDKTANQQKRNFDYVIIAIGSKSSIPKEKQKNMFFTGDMVFGPTTVVEAVAAGKNTAVEVDKALTKTQIPDFKEGKYNKFSKKAKGDGKVKSRIKLQGLNKIPVSLEADFFGRKIISPFLLSAAPPSDGYEQMKKAYEHGWAGGVMKTAFDDVEIHIPGEYMFAITQSTYGNCDNVSGHPLNRVCEEIKKLVNEFPDRLTLASTGGPVTGNDEADKVVWVSNTKKLEAAGVMGIEYSLSCPQGGDGTKGDIVSQDPELTAKIIDWVMEAGDGEIPKLFKLTAAVTAIYPIISAIKAVFAKYPGKKAGVTLANTFPSMAFRERNCVTNHGNWDEGIVVGLSGEGVIPISNLTLANVSSMGITVSGNGGPMDYKAAADFLALGAKTVQFCTIVMKYGYGIIDELHSGLSYLLQEKGLNSVGELIGTALPNPITGFMELTSKKKISDVNKDICEHCGNCTRCPYLAITLNNKIIPKTDASRCIGCSICVQKCFSGALFMRERTEEEVFLLKED